MLLEHAVTPEEHFSFLPLIALSAYGAPLPMFIATARARRFLRRADYRHFSPLMPLLSLAPRRYFAAADYADFAIVDYLMPALTRAMLMLMMLFHAMPPFSPCCH
jgi:hypothetical protein